MHPEKIKTAAVFATMNRADVAEACLRALAAQTQPPELVVVADNVSTDGTADRLKQITNLPFELAVHRMTANRGNAGGVEEAMEISFARGMDAVWILDDDSWPRPDALEQLLAGDWDRNVSRHSIQIDPRSGQLTWPLQVATSGGDFLLIQNFEDLPNQDFFRTRITWTGALISREIRDSVGPVMGELFIRGEDEEYPLRMERNGHPQEAARRSILDHPGPERLICWKFLGKRLFFEPGLADWKLYYKVRNMVWLKRRQSGLLGAIGMAAAYLSATCMTDGIGRLPLLISAARDGFLGRLGKWARHPRLA